MKADLRKLTKQELEGWLKEKNEPKFRAQQIMEWLWQKSVTEISAMTNLSQKLREMMSEEFEIRPVTTYKSQFSSDGTIKSGFKLWIIFKF